MQASAVGRGSAAVPPAPPANIHALTVCLQTSKHEERKMHQMEYLMEKAEKKERSSKTKEKREKVTDEEKELRKERRLGKKRVRVILIKKCIEILKCSKISLGSDISNYCLNQGCGVEVGSI